jgi:iron transport multicopper oxidase
LVRKIGQDGTGRPIFTQVGKTATNGAGRVGIGVPTVTTYKGQAGTGILWVTDPNAGLQAFNAVPVGGVLTAISLPPTGGLNKFLRPAFGDGRLYVSDSNGNIMCLGSPVSLPLQCSQPVDFGNVAISTTKTIMINCTALIPITSISGCSTADHTFQCLNSSLPSSSLAQGATFSFPITWNLTQSSINDAQNSSFGKVLPGVQSTSLDIFTANAVAKYSTLLPISLQGTTVSKTAFLSITPPEVDFGGIVIGGGGESSGLAAAVVISNLGAESLVFTGFGWTDDLDDDGPVTWTNITTDSDGDSVLGNDRHFTSSNFPQVGNTVAPGNSLTIPLLFNASGVGTYQSFLQFWTSGGASYIILDGSAAPPPKGSISVSTSSGGWDYTEPVSMDFGNVLTGTTVAMTLRLCNNGGSAMEITKSKPPVDPELTAANPLTDLHEGQFIEVDSCATAEVDIIAAPLGINRPAHVVSDVWVLNTDGVGFGVHDVNIKANIVTRQLGPLLPDGSARYKYLGCYYDGGGRSLSKQYNNATNENAWCQNTCLANGYKFAGTEYRKSRPLTLDSK